MQAYSEVYIALLILNIGIRWRWDRSNGMVINGPKNWERWAPREVARVFSWRCVSKFACRDWSKVRKTSVRTRGAGPFRNLNPKSPKYEATVFRAHKNGQTQAKSNHQKPVRTHTVTFVTRKYSGNSGTQDDSSMMLFRVRSSVIDRQLAHHQLLLMRSCLSCEEKRRTVATYIWIYHKRPQRALTGLTGDEIF